MKRMALSLLIVLVLCGTAFGNEEGVETLMTAMLKDSNAMALSGNIGPGANREFCAVARIAIKVGEQRGELTKDEAMKLTCLGAALGAWLELGGRTAHVDVMMKEAQRCINEGGYARGFKSR